MSVPLPSYDTPDRCELCGMPQEAGAEMAEMYNPADTLADNVYGHWQCGVERGYELA